MQPQPLVLHTLLAAARQRAGMDEPRCRLVLELIAAAEAVKTCLRTKVGLSEGRFAALVALFATDPTPITSADIASHAGITRSAITDVLDRLEADKLIVRHRDTADRRIIYVNITREGRAEIDAALTRFLAAAGQVADRVPVELLNPLQTALIRVHESAAQVTTALSNPPLST